MTRPGKRLFHGAVLHVRAVLADLGWLAGAGLVVSVILVALPVLVVTITWLFMAGAVVVFPAFPRLLALPARYLSGWMPTWLAVIILLATWLAVAEEASRLGEAAGRARVRRLADRLATCVAVGAAPPPKLKRSIKRVVQARMSNAVDDLELEEAARWQSAEDELRLGDYQAVAVTLAQSAQPETAGVTSAAARFRGWLRLAVVGAVAWLLIGALGVPPVVRDTCLSCRPHSAREHRLWP
jgi:hypothetical protein